MAGVHLHAAVGRVVRRRAVSDGVAGEVGLQPPEQRRRVRLPLVQDVLRLRQDLLQLADVPRQAHQQRVGEPVGGGVVGAAHSTRPCGDRVPQRRRGVVQPQVDVALLGERREHLQAGAREPAGAEDADPLGQVELGRAGSELVAGRVEQLGRRGQAARGRAAAATARPASGRRRRAGRRRRGCRRRPPTPAPSPVSPGRRRRTARRACSRPEAGGPCRPYRRRGAAPAARTRPRPAGTRPAPPAAARPAGPATTRGRRPPASPARAPRRPASSRTGSGRSRRRRRCRRRRSRGRATAAGRASARRPWPAPRRRPRRTGPTAASAAPPRGRTRALRPQRHGGRRARATVTVRMRASPHISTGQPSQPTPSPSASSRYGSTPGCRACTGASSAPQSRSFGPPLPEPSPATGTQVR